MYSSGAILRENDRRGQRESAERGREMAGEQTTATERAVRAFYEGNGLEVLEIKTDGAWYRALARSPLTPRECVLLTGLVFSETVRPTGSEPWAAERREIPQDDGTTLVTHEYPEF